MKRIAMVVAVLAAAFGMVCAVPTAHAESVSAAAAGAAVASGAGRADGAANDLRLWYTQPGSPDAWESTSLVIGNGTTGAILFGQPEREQIHFNDKTLWNGGPSASRRGYDGGNRDEAVTPAQLEALRTRIDDHTSSIFPLGTNVPQEVWGDGVGMGSYQDFGDILLDFSPSGAPLGQSEGYVRDLDLTTGIASVNFRAGGVSYTRRYFASHPDGVVVVRLEASRAGMYSFDLSARAAEGLTCATSAEGQALTLSGTVADNGMRCEMQARVLAEGGTVQADPAGRLSVRGADAVTILYTTGTDYQNTYPAYRSGQSSEALRAEVTGRLDKAAARSFDELRQAHVDDYAALFSRVHLDLGGTMPNIPTDQLMTNYRAGATTRAAEELIYQFGRYLTIASSRAGDELPSNLCGIWMMGSANRYWGADFHFNVNVQMNYWPAYQTNLTECGTVFTDYLESLVVPGRITAERSAGMKTMDAAATPIGEGRGFLVNTQNNPFGCTAPFGGQEYGWNVTGSSWALQNAYDEYRFTRDERVLRERIYPMLREMAVFWDGFLWRSPYQDRLVVAPSFSAEQGPIVNGSTYDQSLVWELYTMAIEASEHLGVDEDLRAGWIERRDALKPIMIGPEGQVKEWFEETTTGRAQAGSLAEAAIPNFGAGGSANQGALHRHTSQLIGLYPGTLINKDNAAWMEAAKTTLKIRGMGGTGWSKAHKINMWARTGDAEVTYELIRAMIAGNMNGILDNLLDSHPPFQIDGNFGLTAGMNECLLQSQLGYTQFLPTLPAAWATGEVSGIVARGNFVIDMAWHDGAADRFAVTSRSGGVFCGEYAGIGDVAVTTEDGAPVAVDRISADRISFETTADTRYIIDFTASTPQPEPSPNPEPQPEPEPSPNPELQPDPSPNPQPEPSPGPDGGATPPAGTTPGANSPVEQQTGGQAGSASTGSAGSSSDRGRLANTGDATTMASVVCAAGAGAIAAAMVVARRRRS